MSDFERQLREHLHSVDESSVRDADAVMAAAAAASRRIDRHRRSVAAIGAVAVVAVGSLAVWSAASDDDRPSTSPVPTESSAPVSTAAETSASPTTTAPHGSWAPIARDPRGVSWYPSVVWTGTEALVLGGTTMGGDVREGFAAFDPDADTWRTLAPFPGGWHRLDPLVVWAGDRMLVIGGTNPDGSLLVSSATAYDPATDTWTNLPSPPIGFVTSRSPFVWTGTELLVWPGDGANGTSTMVLRPMSWSAATGEWSVLPVPPVAPRQSAASVWTGAEWIVWGGTNGSGELADGAAYDPSSQSWRVLAASPLSARRVGAVWTGSEMIVASGSSGGDPTTGNGEMALSDGAAYDPATDSWRPIRDGFAHPGFEMVWTGNGEMALSDGAAYDPATDSWRPIRDGFAHPGFEMVWTGTQIVMVAKGGAVTYDLATDRWLDTCCDGLGAFGPPVWTGENVLVVGSDSPDQGGGLFTPPSP